MKKISLILTFALSSGSAFAGQCSFDEAWKAAHSLQVRIHEAGTSGLIDGYQSSAPSVGHQYDVLRKMVKEFDLDVAYDQNPVAPRVQVAFNSRDSYLKFLKTFYSLNGACVHEPIEIGSVAKTCCVPVVPYEE